MNQIPLGAVPSQQLTVTLAGQACAINVYTLGDYLYMDLAYNGTQVITCRACQTGMRMLLDAQYYGFQGDFTWVDTYASPTVPAQNPVYTGLADLYDGNQFWLIYLSESDLETYAPNPLQLLFELA